MIVLGCAQPPPPPGQAANTPLPPSNQTSLRGGVSDVQWQIPFKAMCLVSML